MDVLIVALELVYEFVNIDSGELETCSRVEAIPFISSFDASEYIQKFEYAREFD